MRTDLTVEEIQARVDALRPWYHCITLPNGIVTPGEPYEPVWNNVRKAREFLSYRGKRVLDTATFDGMWAFEAEQLGAAEVVATDCNHRAYGNFMLCHRLLESNVIPYLNVPIHEQVQRLDTYLKGHNVKWSTADVRPVAESDPIKFDIVHHLGLLYHLRDPLHSLSQLRSLVKDNGKLLIETACLLNEDRSVMQYNTLTPKIYGDITTWWAPSINCLRDMLETSMFEVQLETVSIARFDNQIGRVALVARAVPANEANQALVVELKNTYRTPGMVF